MAQENQYFDLEFFMKHPDPGLYRIAKMIFSYLNARDLKNMTKIREKNKTFDDFLKKEEDSLWKKFEKVTLNWVHPGLLYVSQYQDFKKIFQERREVTTLIQIDNLTIWTITGCAREIMDTVNELRYELFSNGLLQELLAFNKANHEIISYLRTYSIAYRTVKLEILPDPLVENMFHHKWV